MNRDVILEVRNLKKYYPKKTSPLAPPTMLRAVDDVSFKIQRGQTFGLVGESGCGKSTLSRSIVGMHRVTDGEILFEGQRIEGLHGRERRLIQRNMQMVFQNPYNSLNPRMQVGELIEEPMVIQKLGSRREDHYTRVQELLDLVGLGRHSAEKYPHEFSGGQRQRIGIARALALNPSLIICDEPVSALDVSVQAQILNLLRDLQRELGLTYLFISHNLSVVRYMSQTIAVMNAGHIVEMAGAEELYQNPMHPYTQALLSAIPETDPEKRRSRIMLSDDVTESQPETGCAFYPRCWCPKGAVCKDDEVVLRDCGNGHSVSCHRCKPEHGVLKGGLPGGKHPA